MTTALLVIDVQESFRATPRWERRDNLRFEENVARLVAVWRERAAPIAWFLHTDDDPEFRESSEDFRLLAGFTRRGGEPLFVKRTRNCFTSTPLQPWLLEQGARRVAVCGIQTEQCCETTARVARDLGFEVDFISDATQTFPIAGPDGELAARDVRERTEYALRGRFARIVATRDAQP